MHEDEDFHKRQSRCLYVLPKRTSSRLQPARWMGRDCNAEAMDVWLLQVRHERLRAVRPGQRSRQHSIMSAAHSKQALSSQSITSRALSSCRTLFSALHLASLSSLHECDTKKSTSPTEACRVFM